MAHHNPKVPSYRLHKPSGQAVVTLGGTDHYLGEHNSPQSRDKYNELLGRWLANGRRSPDVSSRAPLSVSELILAYFRHCEKVYGARRTKGTRLRPPKRASANGHGDHDEGQNLNANEIATRSSASVSDGGENAF